MSQSDEHRDLVVRAARELGRRFPDCRTTVDVQGRPGDAVPLLIGNHRPDVTAHNAYGSLQCVVEVKVSVRDLESQHTVRQITAFVRYLDSFPDSLFALAVPGALADRARSILALLAESSGPSGVALAVYDGLDLWRRAQRAGDQWHLV